MNEKITVELSKREIILIEQAIGDLYDYCTDDDYDVTHYRYIPTDLPELKP